ncbi:U6 snRNA-associated Sm-like protein LSm7 [Aphelenchoides avenae]|nr:U6 snRNA-associated Sm-like protein LSm7 [Aphelenchus avenae]
MAPQDESGRKKKESIVDLARFIDKRVRVKFQGGREATGILKGYDALLNLVLDNAVEFLRDPEDMMKMTEETRNLGLIVARGTAITVVAPNEGVELIDNPFIDKIAAEET